jgi:hypothetical protein
MKGGIARLSQHQQRIQMAVIFRGLMNFFGIRAVADELSVFECDPLPGILIPVIRQPLSVGCEIAKAGGPRLSEGRFLPLLLFAGGIQDLTQFRKLFGWQRPNPRKTCSNVISDIAQSPRVNLNAHMS